VSLFLEEQTHSINAIMIMMKKYIQQRGVRHSERSIIIITSDGDGDEEERQSVKMKESVRERERKN
jgi:hypothetical protein